jgi:peptidoglycan hydrolase-like protein with peptidoglycan-binding domain
VSGTEAREQAAGPVAPPQAEGGRAGPVLPGGTGSGQRGGRRRRVAAMLAGVAVVAAGSVAALAAAGVFSRPGHPGRGGTRGTATQVVSRQTLISQTAVNATLGYAGSYTVTGRAPGTVTWLPVPGRVIREGGVLYRTGNGVPTYLLYGRVPAWRALQEGMRGGDVRQLNHDLAALGYANSGYISALGWDYFSWETAHGLEQLQGAAGLEETGELPLGQAVFEPGALRVSTVSASLGSPASGQIFTATSARPVVTISLDAAEQPEVKTGDKVSVTMPDGTPAPGVITSVGKVASGTGNSATITVDVRLLHPKAAGGLDEAPVTVNITTGSVKNVLVVPVDALLAQAKGEGEAGGGYAVEVVGATGTHHLVRVSLGMFDNAAGLVQVSGPGLAVGQHVVVPSL